MRLIAAFCFAALLSAGSAWAQAPSTPPPPPPRVAPVAPAGLEWARYPNASEVVLRNIAAYVRVRPQERDDVAIAIVNQGPLPAPVIRRSGDRLIVDGRQRGQVRGCSVSGAAAFEVELARLGRVSGARLPIIEVRVPMTAVVTVTGAARVHVGSADSAKIGLDGCGDVDIERVAD
ncbi:MAG: hypothetical protein K2X34_04865, partial [Hyphomonadaceae bacterium]|nr:hypothetical protein [Hyphomonadaceae bacterium]